MSDKEPSCVQNHAVIRRGLRDKGLPTVRCAICGWRLYPAVFAEDDIAEVNVGQIEELKAQLAASEAAVATLRTERDEAKQLAECCGVTADTYLAGLQREVEKREQAEAEIATLRQHDEIGWNGLAKLYEIITGQTCDPAVGLGMATSAVAQLQSAVATLRQALRNLHMLGRRGRRKKDRDGAVHATYWDHVVRICEEAGVSSDMGVLRDALAAVPAPAAPPVPSTVVHVVVGEPMRCGYCGEKATEFYSFNSDVQPDICPECYALAASAAPAAPQE